MKYEKVVCIVQARMGSTRLPGKVLREVCGKTILEHDIDRLKRIRNIDEVVIATTYNMEDDVIENKALSLGINCFRGSENDVLSRYYYAAKKYNADIIVRVTSDCPLIDYEISEKIIQYYLDNRSNYDYVSNTLERTYPRGFDTEIFNFLTLEKTFLEAKKDVEREHVTPYIWTNKDLFKIYNYKGFKDYSQLRWTLDTKEDLQLITEIYSLLYDKKGSQFNINDILYLYSKFPRLYNINKDIKQKLL